MLGRGFFLFCALLCTFPFSVSVGDPFDLCRQVNVARGMDPALAMLAAKIEKESGQGKFRNIMTALKKYGISYETNDYQSPSIVEENLAADLAAGLKQNGPPPLALIQSLKQTHPKLRPLIEELEAKLKSSGYQAVWSSSQTQNLRDPNSKKIRLGTFAFGFENPEIRVLLGLVHELAHTDIPIVRERGVGKEDFIRKNFNLLAEDEVTAVMAAAKAARNLEGLGLLKNRKMHTEPTQIAMMLLQEGKLSEPEVRAKVLEYLASYQDGYYPRIWKSYLQETWERGKNPDFSIAAGGISMGGKEGASLGLHSMAGMVMGEAEKAKKLELRPGQVIIIGRAADPRKIPYLHPDFITETTVMGDMTNFGVSGEMSRGHAMLKGHAEGLMLINGMPSNEDGTKIRAPGNGTYLVTPVADVRLPDGIKLLIRHGETKKFRLPGNIEIEITAE